MVSELDSGSSNPGSSPGQGHCVVFLGKTLNSHNASLHPAGNLGPSQKILEIFGSGRKSSDNRQKSHYVL